MKKGELLFLIGRIIFFVTLAIILISSRFGFAEEIYNTVFGVCIGVQIVAVGMIVVGAKMRSKEKNEK